MNLIDSHDAALFDLDGVIYLGEQAIDGVPEALAQLREQQVKVGFVTNNAAKTPHSVAEHLTRLGITAEADDVVVSTQATLRQLREQLPAGAKVLAVGSQAMVELLTAGGYHVVTTAAEEPVAVVQGYHPQLPWELLEEGVIAVQAGARWFVTNPDETRPTDRGIMPGCGAQSDLVAKCVNVDPIIAGKPYRPLLDETVQRLDATAAIFVGDRLDTDIMGANVVGMASLFVFTGAHGKADLAAAAPTARPTHIGYGLEALFQPIRRAELTADGASCGDMRITLHQGAARLATPAASMSEQLDALWAALNLTWQQGIDVSAVLPELTELP